MKMRAFGFSLVVSVSALMANPASASDAIATGRITGLTSREGFLMFAVISNHVNLCGPCPADPGNFGSGGLCWVSEADATKVQMLLAAKMEGTQINGRVESITTDCAMYQLQLSDF